MVEQITASIHCCRNSIERQKVPYRTPLVSAHPPGYIYIASLSCSILFPNLVPQRATTPPEQSASSGRKPRRVEEARMKEHFRYSLQPFCLSGVNCGIVLLQASKPVLQYCPQRPYTPPICHTTHVHGIQVFTLPKRAPHRHFGLTRSRCS